ncbi:hypothetical protein LMH87_005010 [Akanthomyces muscarius]|uniref:Uncharacterized protein n=1 Tax=Akanthomyces muscarius TaxID=2231603 RepID=A0A9W8URP6_AKAMU|nr:hypothetical protein LMH87_005010 [Akanthomyces muscarius]KAJ4163269.1 hypothetical protein LMH87_005010 [Akanthomyces muscarius]
MLAKSPQRHDIALGHVQAARVGLFIADGESPLGEAFGKLFDALIFKIMIYMPDEYYKTSAAANVAAAADMYRQVEELGQKTWVESMAKVGVHRSHKLLDITSLVFWGVAPARHHQGYNVSEWLRSVTRNHMRSRA